MIRTPLCDVLNIQYPIIQAAIAPYTTAELVSAVSNAGGMGSIGSALRSMDDLRMQVARTKELTSRPFAINFTITTFNEDIFNYVVSEAKPRIVSSALGNPKELVKRVHDAGLLFMHQVHTVKQARQAAELGVDVIIAQGSEAGGFTGNVSSLSLVPQVVDAVADKKIPVIAAGGIADGRGLAAALMLGAQGVNMGTRFLASSEASLVGPEWQKQIISAESEDAIKVNFLDSVFPVANPDAYGEIAPRALRTRFIEEWNIKSGEAKSQAPQLRSTILTGIKEGRSHELVPFSGQSAGLIRNVLPAKEIITNIMNEAEERIRSLKANALS
ncbi:2-nitropropane dioxygenase-like enzyme [Candidatus Nitrososphaera evergladensis SR1]|jgi:enoyl-[acyl-carrier protein] reductase II|uniref:2-nitropropane dioxygenase-like enzyme n=1 Tax=Candidatus Nitrososphaera evergladensis SR1 TaxID=1459636 RepID=A0A075MN83_9ARCH|nr:nitronate monooxygenase [Candidatus Nitrososphaera evergladensis]AIF82615.1 2-nitropropane dioxygenase-like enzyme [Candidatus Nitrososphaera evergladensis SR1]